MQSITSACYRQSSLNCSPRGRGSVKPLFSNPAHLKSLQHSALSNSTRAVTSGRRVVSVQSLFGLRSPPVEVELEQVDRSDVKEITSFFVNAFFVNGIDEEDVRESSIRQLVNSQAFDIRLRYTGGKNQESLMLCLREEEAGEVVGCVGLEVANFIGQEQLSRTPTRGESAECELRPVVANLAVDTSYRRSGFAKKLMQACEDQVKEWGYDEILLFVESDNEKAKKLYNKLGYKREWITNEATAVKIVEDGRLSDETVELWCLRKRLSGGGGLFGMF